MVNVASLKPALRKLEKKFEEVEKAPAVAMAKGYLDELKTRSAELLKVGRARSSATAKRAKQFASDPAVQVTAASAGGGGAVVGTAGAGVGLAAGATVGAAVGILPGLVTFGLAIPVAAVIGGGCGLALGGLAGTTAGLAGGGAIGYTSYSRRQEIRKWLVGLRLRVQNARKVTSQKTNKAVARAKTSYSTVEQHVVSHAKEVKTKTLELAASVQERSVATATQAQAKTLEVISDKTVQATAASAAGGAVVLGTGGAATGMVAGGAIGAAVGVPAALFTFGLSIPFCAVIGGGCGLATGTAVGSTTGGVVGGLGGYTAFTRREAIGSAYENVKDKAFDSAGYVRAKLVGATGGTC